MDTCKLLWSPPVVLRVLRLRPVPQPAEDGQVDAEDDQQGQDELHERGAQVVRRPEGKKKDRNYLDFLKLRRIFLTHRSLIMDLA